MLTYILRRLLAAIPVLALMSLITFLIMRLIPGDAAMVLAGPSATPAEVEVLRQALGLDYPWYTQLITWYWRLLHGNLGDSLTLGRSVWQAIVERAPVTLSLAIYALLLTLLVGIFLGMIAAVRQNTYLDGIAMFIALVGVSVPNFWLGLMLIFLFAVSLGWLPSGGYIPLTESFVGWLRHLTLPAVSLALMQIGLLARMTRSSMLEVLRQDYIRTARAYGVREGSIIGRHALMNALIPIVTLVGITFSLMLAGAVVVETVYSLPGIGRMVISAVSRRDLPVIQGGLLLVGAIFVIINLLVDVLYVYIDPRVRLR